ncbi:hypothetical protein [Pendulispora albinea]|uniref:Uncharacterized protein n=1 Tax=Pendulispora albinea TaxID=2741071 RepID=A0ABZ2M2J0_9BACT
MRSASLFSLAKLGERIVLGAALVCVLAACGSKPASSAGGAGDTRIGRFAVSAQSFKVDKVGGADGSLDPNGVPDAVLEAAIDGAAIGVALVAHDAQGNAVAQWDTLTGADKLPSGAGLYSTHGDSTPGLVLVEGGQRLNHNDGSISPLSGHHEVTLYADVRDVESAKTLELILLTADGQIVRGPRIPFQQPEKK